MAQTNEQIDIRELCIKVLKNWYWFVLSCFLCGCLGILYYCCANKNYSTNATIMLRDDAANKNPLASSDMMSMLGMGGSKRVDDEIAIITSRGIMQQAIVALDLQTCSKKKTGLRWVNEYPKSTFLIEYPKQFCDTTTDGVSIDIKVKKDGYKLKVKYGRFLRSKHFVTDLNAPINTCLGTLQISLLGNTKAGEHFHISTSPVLPLIDKYREDLHVNKLKKDSKVINLNIVSDAPKRDVDLLGKIIELYNLDAVVDKNILATNTAVFIEERLNLITNELSDAEDDVETYKREHQIANLGEEAKLYILGSSEYQKRIAEVETQLNLVSYIQEFVNDDSKRFSMIPANLGIEDAALMGIISDYNDLLLKRMKVQRTASDSNPVIEQLNDQLLNMRQNIIASIASVRESLNITKQGLINSDSQFSNRIKSVPTQERQFIEIQRRKQLKEQLYLFLFQKREENALMLASAVTPAKVMDIPLQSTKPISPRLRYVGLFCLILGLCIPAGIMYLKAFFNNTIEDKKHYERMINAPFLGEIVQNSRGKHIAIAEGENTVSAELFRLLRTNLKFMLPSDKTPVILVTSSINGEGKSYISTNTAISLAMLGKKVALVGLDIRKPMLAQYFGLSNSGCLTSYLAEPGYEIDDIILPSGQHSNLDLIPAGAIPPNPNELLQCDRLDTLIAELRKRYDIIIIDSAPVALVSDTFLLDRIADMTIYVSREGYTPLDMVDFLNKVHAEKRLKNMACVLNGVKSVKAGYGYGITQI